MKMLQAAGQRPTSPEMPNNLDSHVLRVAVNIRGRDYIQWSQPLTTQNLKEFTCLKHGKNGNSPVVYEINLNKPGFFYRHVALIPMVRAWWPRSSLWARRPLLITGALVLILLVTLAMLMGALDVGSSPRNIWDNMASWSKLEMSRTTEKMILIWMFPRRGVPQGPSSHPFLWEFPL